MMVKYRFHFPHCKHKIGKDFACLVLILNIDPKTIYIAPYLNNPFQNIGMFEYMMYFDLPYFH